MYKVLFNSQTVNEFDTPEEAEDFANSIVNNKTDIAFYEKEDTVSFEGTNGFYELPNKIDIEN